jgi:hypothetical protein
MKGTFSRELSGMDIKIDTFEERRSVYLAIASELMHLRWSEMPIDELYYGVVNIKELCRYYRFIFNSDDREVFTILDDYQVRYQWRNRIMNKGHLGKDLFIDNPLFCCGHGDVIDITGDCDVNLINSKPGFSTKRVFFCKLESLNALYEECMSGRGDSISTNLISVAFDHVKSNNEPTHYFMFPQLSLIHWGREQMVPGFVCEIYDWVLNSIRTILMNMYWPKGKFGNKVSQKLYLPKVTRDSKFLYAVWNHIIQNPGYIEDIEFFKDMYAILIYTSNFLTLPDILCDAYEADFAQEQKQIFQFLWNNILDLVQKIVYSNPAGLIIREILNNPNYVGQPMYFPEYSRTSPFDYILEGTIVIKKRPESTCMLVYLDTGEADTFSRRTIDFIEDQREKNPDMYSWVESVFGF